MKKYEVTCSCGHKKLVDLDENDFFLQDRLKWYETYDICDACTLANTTYSEIRMHYREYKEEYANCKTKYGSYDDSDKTIIVYVPD